VVVKQPLVILYDIPDDKVRYKVAEACKDYGLERIQYSAFLGHLNGNRREELALRLKREVKKKSATVHLFQLRPEQLEGAVLIQNLGGEG
jgi:CRISPR-associated protein Cas2